MAVLAILVPGKIRTFPSRARKPAVLSFLSVLVRAALLANLRRAAHLLFGIQEGSATRWREAELGLFERVYHRPASCQTVFWAFCIITLISVNRLQAAR